MPSGDQLPNRSPQELRWKLDMSQAEIARAFRVSKNTWARWERGELGIHPAYGLLLELAWWHAYGRWGFERARQVLKAGGVRALLSQHGALTFGVHDPSVK